VIDLSEKKLAEIENRTKSGGFTFMWPSEVIALVTEVRTLRERLEQAEWNEELALMALDSQESKIKPETLLKIDDTVRRLVGEDTQP